MLEGLLQRPALAAPVLPAGFYGVSSRISWMPRPDEKVYLFDARRSDPLTSNRAGAPPRRPFLDLLESFPRLM